LRPRYIIGIIIFVAIVIGIKAAAGQENVTVLGTGSEKEKK
jgi:hypothetical protein